MDPITNLADEAVIIDDAVEQNEIQQSEETSNSAVAFVTEDDDDTENVSVYMDVHVLSDEEEPASKANPLISSHIVPDPKDSNDIVTDEVVTDSITSNNPVSSELVGDSMLLFATQTDDGQIIHVPYTGENQAEEVYIVQEDADIVLGDSTTEQQEYFIESHDELGVQQDTVLEQERGITIDNISQDVFVESPETSIFCVEQEVECEVDCRTDNNESASISEQPPSIVCEDLTQDVMAVTSSTKRKSDGTIPSPKRHMSSSSHETLSPNSSIIQVHHPTISNLLGPTNKETVTEQLAEPVSSTVATATFSNITSVAQHNILSNTTSVVAPTVTQSVEIDSSKQFGNLTHIQIIEESSLSDSSASNPVQVPSGSKPVLVNPNLVSVSLQPGMILTTVPSVPVNVPILPNVQPQKNKSKSHTSSAQSVSMQDETLADHYMKNWKPTGQHQCKFCTYSCVTRNFLFRHWLMMHCTLKPYSCALCGMSSPNKEGITRHYTARHKGCSRDIVVDLESEQTVMRQFSDLFIPSSTDAIEFQISNSTTNMLHTTTDSSPPNNFRYVTPDGRLVREIIVASNASAGTIVAVNAAVSNTSTSTAAIVTAVTCNDTPTMSSSVQSSAKKPNKVEPMTMQRLKQVLEGKLDEHYPDIELKAKKRGIHMYDIPNPSTRHTNVPRQIHEPGPTTDPSISKLKSILNQPLSIKPTKKPQPAVVPVQLAAKQTPIYKVVDNTGQQQLLQMAPYSGSVPIQSVVAAAGGDRTGHVADIAVVSAGSTAATVTSPQLKTNNKVMFLVPVSLTS